MDDGAVAGTKRGSEDVGGRHSKKARTSNAQGTTARVGGTRSPAPAQPVIGTQRRSKRGNQEQIDVPTEQAMGVSKHAAAPTTEPSNRNLPAKKTTNTSALTAVGSSSDVAPIQGETNSPSWFSRTLVMLQSESKMGQKWMELVRVWALFEMRSRYEEIKKLSPTDHPTAVAEWIGQARSSTWRPAINDVP